MNLRKLLISGGLTAGLIIGLAPAASATNGPPDLCDIIPSLPQCDEPEPGPQGPPGPEGPQGPVGPEGPQGPQGEQGERGPRGYPGSDGLTPVAICTADGGIYFVTEEPEQLPEGSFYPNAEYPCYGPTGPAGPQGEPGPAGADGTDGVDGKDGIDGLNGADGETSHTSEVIVKTEPVDNSIVTELNNRLFVLEHTDPQAAEVQGEQITAPTPSPGDGELPHTGSDWVWPLVVVGLAGLAAGGLLLVTTKK